MKIHIIDPFSYSNI